MASNEKVEGDPLLAHLARLQLIENKVTQISELETKWVAVNTTKTPWPFHLRALQAEFKVVKEAIPSHLQRNRESIL